MQEYMDLEGQGWVGKTSPEKRWNSPSSLINPRRVRSLDISVISSLPLYLMVHLIKLSSTLSN